MKAFDLLARAALFAYPAEFRVHHGDEIIADIEDGAPHPFMHLIDLIRSGITMRIDALWRDVVYAVRRLRSAPLFVAIVVLTFALGIGANVAVYSVLDQVVLRPLPFPDPGSLAIVQFHAPGGDVYPATSMTDASDIRAHDKTIASISAVASDQPTLLVGGHPYSLTGIDVMPEYFTMLGLRPQVGRLLDARDGKPGVHTIVISNELWHKRFGADPAIVGRSVSLDGVERTVLGILRPGQMLAIPAGEGIENLDFIGGLPEKGLDAERGRRISGSIVRLAPGVSLAHANADLRVVSQRLQHLYPRTNAKAVFSLESFNGAVLGATSSALWLIFAAAFGILLIACANVGNLLGARWSARDRELAIRRSLGASSARIAAQLLVETGILALVGAAFGVLLAYTALQVIASSLAPINPSTSAITIDAVSLLYALGIVIVATLLAGIIPLLGLRTRDLQSALKTAGRDGDGSGRHRLRSVLVVFEIALALALVVVSGLMVRSFIALSDTPLGIGSDGVVVTDAITFPASDASDGARAQVERLLLDALRAVPGVDSAALSMTYPLGDVGLESNFPVEGRVYAPGSEPLAWINPVSAEYFRALGIPVVRGRAFDYDDVAGSSSLIVNQAFVTTYLNGKDPIGVRVRLQTKRPDRWASIVGVVGNSRIDLTMPYTPEVYLPLSANPSPFIDAVVHGKGVDLSVLGREVQSAFARALPTVQAPGTYTMSARVTRRTVQTQLGTSLLAVLGVIALLLACAGIFGVVSFSVTQRLREFGIRIALGATARDVIGDVLRRSYVTTSYGVVIGLVLASLAAHAIVAQLSNVSPFDPLTFTLVVVLIFASSMLASLHPALRATHAEPVEALRYE